MLLKVVEVNASIYVDGCLVLSDSSRTIKISMASLSTRTKVLKQKFITFVVPYILLCRSKICFERVKIKISFFTSY